MEMPRYEVKDYIDYVEPLKRAPTFDELRAAREALLAEIYDADARGDWREVRRLIGHPVTPEDEVAIAAAEAKRARKAAKRLAGRQVGERS